MYCHLAIYRDVESTSSKAEWVHPEPETIGVGVDISADGSVIALLYYADVSYLRPATMGVRGKRTTVSMIPVSISCKRFLTDLAETMIFPIVDNVLNVL